MPSRSLSVVVQQLRAAAARRDGAGRTDGDLLTHFLKRRDDDALAALVERHAPMVWGVCCRLLRNPHDVEDAFQATFLVLVQKAATVVPREMVANWLHGVAQQTAVRLRAMAAKRGGREVQMDEMPEPATAEARDEELLSRLDEELSRLPERFRALIVLCDLEGHTRKDVARQLGCPEGTVASGLARARELLAKRLTRRGLAVSGGSLASALSHSMASADVPASVVTSAINVATLLAAGKAAGVISGPIANLTQGVLKTMFLKKILTTTMAVLALGVAVITGGSLAVGQTEGKSAVGKDVKTPVAEKPVEPAAKQEKAKKDADVAWGNEENGLQLGLVLVPADKTAYRPGETMELGIRVRNVSKEKITGQHGRQESTPTLTDAKSEKVHVAMPPYFDFGIIEIPTGLTLLPGETAELFKRTVFVGEVQKGKVESKGVVSTPTIRVGAGKYKIASSEMVQRNLVATTPVLTPVLLKTGEVEFEVKEGGEKALPEMKEVFTAWGKEVGGLQAGVAVVPGDERQYKPGDRVAFEVKVRNVGKEAVTITYSQHERAPEITDSQGKQVRVTIPPPKDYLAPLIQRVLKPAETMTLFKNAVVVETEVLEPQKGPEAQVSTPTIRVGPGTYKIGIGGMVQSHPKLSTGSVEFVVKPAKDAPADGPSIAIDNTPEQGIPAEAMAQQHRKPTAQEEALIAKGEIPIRFTSLTDGTIKSVRIRYFNNMTWTNEKDVREYVAGMLQNKASEAHLFQVWSQGAVAPEIECIVEFTEEHRKKLLAEKKRCAEGRLLIWDTRCCFRDATGNWSFVTMFDQFHRSHPNGDRGLVKEAKPK